VNEGHLHFCGSDVWREMVEEFLPDALAGVDLGPDVLEIGPGPGFTTDLLRQRASSLTAVEIDPVLFAALADRLADTNVTVLLGDASALDFGDDRFSGAASFNMLHHVPSLDAQQRVLAELARVVRPGGSVVLVDSGFSPGLHDFHAADTYNPIEPEILPDRLAAAGLVEVEVRRFDLNRWVCTASAA
jgi:SAM-dependent methyltransferase